MASSSATKRKLKLKVKERDIEQAVCDYAMKQGAIACVKMNLMGRRGWPDRQFFFPGGCTFFIEFKRPEEYPTPGQWAVIDMLRENGFEVEVVSYIEHGKNIIDARLGLDTVGAA